MPKYWERSSMQRGQKCVWSWQRSHKSVPITAMFVFPASGMMYPPRLYIRTKEITDSSWWLGRSQPTGWMTADVFYKYIGNVFAPQLGRKMSSSLLHFSSMDTHLTYQLNALCSGLGIILVSLHWIATRLLQPLDLATVRPLKMGWKTAVLEWHRQNSSARVAQAKQQS